VHVRVGKRLGLAFGAEEDRADHRALPLNRHDDDRPHVSRIERGLDRAQHRVVRRIRDEHRLLRLERPLQFRIAIQVDDEIPNSRIFIARDEPHLILLAGEKNRAAVEAKRIAEFACDALQDVNKVQRRRDFLQNIDYSAKMITLALQLGDATSQPGQFVVRRELLRCRLGFGRRRVVAPDRCPAALRRLSG